MLSGRNTLYTLDNLSEPKTIEYLAKSTQKYPISAFSVQDGRISAGWLNKVINLGEKRAWMVTLDDGSTVYAAETQEFMLLDGSLKSLSGLHPGISLMPLYLSYDTSGYPKCFEPSDYNLSALTTIDCRKTRKVARIAAESKAKDRLGLNTFVKHIDGNRKNCDPNNLEIEIDPDREPIKINNSYIKALKEAQNLINLHLKKRKRNHKIVEISLGGMETMYGLASSESTNFAVSGIFIKTVDCE